MSYVFFFVLSVLLAFVLLKRKSSVYIFVIVFPVFFALNYAVHEYSISIGKEGYSVFTKGILNDEIIYYGEAKEMFESIKNGEFLSLISKNSIFFNHFYSVLLFLVFSVFNSSEIFLARAVSALFFALFFVQINRFIQIGTNKTNVYPLIFLLLLYPTLTIRGLQIEQEMFVNFIMLSIVNQIITSKTKLKYVLTLFFFKILAFVPLVGAWINSKLKIHFFLQLLLIPVLLISFLKILLPSAYNYVLSVKRYVVMDGRHSIFTVDYDGVIGIVKTTLSSTYYFLFAPLDITTILSGSMSFKILLIEPLILIVCLFYIYKNKEILKAINKLYMVLSFLFYYMLSYIMVESHITSLMRRRVIVYVVILLLALVIFRKKNKFVFGKSKLLTE